MRLPLRVVERMLRRVLSRRQLGVRLQLGHRRILRRDPRPRLLVRVDAARVQLRADRREQLVVLDTAKKGSPRYVTGLRYRAAPWW
jgi:hypothetical protein